MCYYKNKFGILLYLCKSKIQYIYSIFSLFNSYLYTHINTIIKYAKLDIFFIVNTNNIPFETY